MREYQLKQNPAPDEWSVLIIAPSDTRTKIVTVVTFKGERAFELAEEYNNLMICLQAGAAQIIAVPGKGLSIGNSNPEHE